MSNNKVFLGGTCAGSTWRELLIPQLTVEYFNPVVEDWTPDMIEIEEMEKKGAGTHLYLINVKMEGVYSIAEVVESTFDKTKNTVFCVSTYGFTDGQKKSLAAVSELVERNGGIVLTNVQTTELAAVLNTLEPIEEETDNVLTLSPTPVVSEEYTTIETVGDISNETRFTRTYKV